MHRSPGRRVLSACVGSLGVLIVAVGAPSDAAAYGPAPASPPDLATLALGWTFEPLVAIPIMIFAVAWVAMVSRIDREHPESPVPLVRTVAFLGGLAAIAIALMSGIAAYDTTLFSVHMVQHLLLMLVAAPLLVYAAPITQLLRAASPRVRQRWILPILRSGPVVVLSHPVVAWLVFTIVLWVSHFSPLFNLALDDPGVHDLEHAMYLGAALLFWWPVVGVDPSPHRMSHPVRVGYLLLQMPFSSFLAMAVLFTAAPLYPHYAALGTPYGTTALEDQQLAAAIMWLVGDGVFIGSILLIVAGWMRHEERLAPAADRRADAARLAIHERAERLAGRGTYREVVADPQVPEGSGEASSVR
jgi:cytochrome c oxidase assembly factor CtaG